MDSEQMDGVVKIENHDYWFKIVEYLQQNWALIDPYDQGAIAWFVSDGSGVFDKIIFPSIDEA
jgi:hypothetical protein